ncbi:MAG: carbohydrate ABC transporter permease [Chloroflexi bacterium]|nr:carbohydrate ABC transporter permease [Chloroflexota bacterium]
MNVGLLPRRLPDAVGYVLLVAGAVVMLIPIFWMISTSLKPLNNVFTLPVEWWPTEPHFENYVSAWNRFPFGRYLTNSTIVSLAVTVLNVILSGFAGFALAKYRFFGRDVFFLAILATLMLPIEALMVPTFLIVKQLSWLNSFQGLIIPAVADAFGVFLMRQTMLHVPDALLEAARIDGASEIRIYFQIIMPLLWPATLTLSIFVWRETWDAFVWPLLIISQDQFRTVPIGLQRFQEENITIYNEVMAMSFVVMLPLAILFFIFQRAFIQGIAGTGIKE